MVHYGKSLWGAMTRQENDEFVGFLSAHSADTYKKKWHKLNEHYGFADYKRVGLETVQFVREKRESKTPFSIVRLNDGEGSVIFGEVFPKYNDSKLDSYISRKISEIIFGNSCVIPSDLEKFRKIMKDAVMYADIIGAPEESFIERRLSLEDPKKVDVRAVCGTYAQISYLYDLSESDILKKNQYITTAWISKYLLPHYKKIFSMFSDIYIVTGNKGLGQLVSKYFGVGSIVEISIPTQRALKGKEGNKKLMHWPFRYQEVLSELKLIPEGSLVFVAAGVLGKGYCSEVKVNGSSSIDIGHVADIWYGDISRPGISNKVIDEWSLQEGL